MNRWVLGGGFAIGVGVISAMACADSFVMRKQIGSTSGAVLSSPVYSEGITDAFTTESGVNTANSANQTYNAAGDYYTSLGVVNAIPVMTSDTAPSGVASASSNDPSPGYGAWRAFDNTGTSWISNSGLNTGWVAYQFPTPQTIVQYTVQADVASRAPKDWTFQAFSGSWVTLDTQTGQTGWGAGETRTFSIPNTTAYSSYRINVTANNGNSRVQILEMQMMSSGTTPDFTLLSNAAAATTAPHDGQIEVLHESVDAVTPGTDIKAFLSCDGGGTFAEVTGLANSGTEGGYDILTGAIPIVNCGTSMVWKLTTHNAKAQRIHRVKYEWASN